jgi:hypothetical protein
VRHPLMARVVPRRKAGRWRTSPPSGPASSAGTRAWTVACHRLRPLGPTYVEEPDLIQVYPLLPGIPEARRARRRTVAFLRA